MKTSKTPQGKSIDRFNSFIDMECAPLTNKLITLAES